MHKYLLLIPAFFIAFAIYGEAIECELSFDPAKVTISQEGDFAAVSLNAKGMAVLAKPGDPALPAYRTRVLLPYNAAVTSVEVVRDNPVSFGLIRPAPFQGYQPLSLPRKESTPANAAVYRAAAPFPAESALFQGTGDMRGFRMAYLAYYPFEWLPDTGELLFYPTARLRVHIADSDSKAGIYQANSLFTSMAAQSVENPTDLMRFYPGKLQSTDTKANHDMLIVTTQGLLSGANDYADFKQSQGISTAVKTVDQIDSQYTGATIQIKIKQCVKDYVDNHNITYVLLIGDAGTNPTYSVPDQNTYVNPGYYADNTIPADVFYSCLDDQFDWNADGDNRVGEINQDNADIAPEVIIGRLPVRTVQQIADYQAKVAQYQNQYDNETFIKNLLLVGVTLWSTGDAKAKSEKMYAEYIQPNWAEHTKHTLYASDPGVTVSASNLSDMFEQHMNYMHMATHGSVDSWSMESGYSFSSTTAMNLQNIPGIIVTISCLIGGFDPEVSGATDPCLSEAFVRNPDGGAVVFIGAARYGWGDYNHNAHGSSFQYNDLIFEHMLKDDLNHITGAALMQAKLDKVGDANSSYDGTMRWVHFALNLNGDPSIQAYVEEGNLQTTPVYRFFNTRNGAYFYTISTVERDYIMANMPHYNYEGDKFSVYAQETPKSTPVYRFYNTLNGVHLYTISAVERDYIMANMPHYNYEGVKFHVHKNQETGSTPLYRFFNTRNGVYLYTISTVERDYIINNLPHYNYEGVKFYVFPPTH